MSSSNPRPVSGAERDAQRQLPETAPVELNTERHAQLRASGQIKASTYESAMEGLRAVKEHKEKEQRLLWGQKFDENVRAARAGGKVSSEYFMEKCGSEAGQSVQNAKD